MRDQEVRHKNLEAPAPVPGGDVRDFLRALACWEAQYAPVLTPEDRQYIAHWEGPELQRVRAFLWLVASLPPPPDPAGMLERADAAMEAWERFKRIGDREGGC